MRATNGRTGLTLLEVLVALVILSLVVVGYLQIFHASHQLLARSREWSAVVAYAVDGMEQAKRATAGFGGAPDEALAGGLRRQIAIRPWHPGLRLLTVGVTLPTGGRFDLYRLQESRTSHVDDAPDAGRVNVETR